MNYKEGLDYWFAEKECIMKEKEVWNEEDLESRRLGRMERDI